MRLIIYVILTLAAAALLAVSAHEDPGSVIINFRGWAIEVSAIFFVGVLLTGFVALYAAFRLLVAVGLMPRRLKHWNKQRQHNKGQQALVRGLLELNQGQWYEAEQRLIKCAKNPAIAPMALIGAAEAAQAQGNIKRRDGYLLTAHAEHPKSALAISLAKARMQFENGQPDDADKTLQKLPGNEQNHPQVLRQTADNFIKLHEWRKLVNLLPRMKRHKALPQCNFYELEHEAYSGLLNHIGRDKDSQALRDLWNNMPPRLRDKEDMVIDYAASMINCGCANQVEETLYNHIGRNWSDALVHVYGLLDGDAEIHLARARNWLKKHSNNHVLLLTLGRLAMRAHQWPQAQEYLEASLRIVPNPDAFQELGNLLSVTQQPAQALECFRRALTMSTDTLIQPGIKSGNVERAQLPKFKPLKMEHSAAQVEDAQIRSA